MVLQRGMPSRGGSSTHSDYVPALCTHRPSLLPIESDGEKGGEEKELVSLASKPSEPPLLEEGEVVTRFS